jgi:hypothetical protein
MGTGSDIFGFVAVSAPSPSRFTLVTGAINLFSLAYLVFVIIWMSFLTMLPVTGSNMNYAGPILLAVILGSIVDWVVSGHKRFQFPIAKYIPQD